MPDTCEHLEGLTAADFDPFDPPDACQDCLIEGTRWVHLRECQTCGHMGCCDSSPRRHATAHFHGTGHPVIRSAQPGEFWDWCFVHEVGGQVPPG